MRVHCKIISMLLCQKFFHNKVFGECACTEGKSFIVGKGRTEKREEEFHSRLSRVSMYKDRQKKHEAREGNTSLRINN